MSAVGLLLRALNMDDWTPADIASSDQTAATLDELLTRLDLTRLGDFNERDLEVAATALLAVPLICQHLGLDTTEAHGRIQFLIATHAQRAQPKETT